jgi:ADP-ribose pyrophosphatase YjhB (NUDIX family)
VQSPGIGCGIVFLRDAHILLLKRKKSPEAGAWGIPGGKVDFLETAEQAIRREALEETGLRAGAIALLGLSEQLFHDERQHWLGVLFLAQSYSGEMQLIDWFSLDELPERLTLPTLHAIDLVRQRGLA